jgi:hypothetical protein
MFESPKKVAKYLADDDDQDDQGFDTDELDRMERELSKKRKKEKKARRKAEQVNVDVSPNEEPRLAADVKSSPVTQAKMIEESISMHPRKRKLLQSQEAVEAIAAGDSTRSAPILNVSPEKFKSPRRPPKIREDFETQLRKVVEAGSVSANASTDETGEAPTADLTLKIESAEDLFYVKMSLEDLWTRKNPPSEQRTP